MVNRTVHRIRLTVWPTRQYLFAVYLEVPQAEIEYVFLSRAPTRLKACKFLDVSHEDDGDEDVMAEKLKVKEMITCQDCEEVNEPVLILPS